MVKNEDNHLKQFVIDFLEGRISPKDFMIRFQKDEQLVTWLQSIVPKEKQCYVAVTDDREWTGYRHVAIPYDIKRAIGKSLEKIWDLGEQLNVHSEIATLFAEAFPEEKIEKNKTIENQFVFLITTCPNYVGGKEASELISRILSNLPEELSKTKRAKLFRERIKDSFHLDGKHYPRWYQEPEWPFNNDKPMKFVSQASKSEIAFYLFVDVDTGDERVIKQFT